MNRYTENVKRGAALLDRERPGWREHIDTHQLDLSICGLCILGQIFDGYENGIRTLLSIDPNAYDADSWLCSFGYQTVVAHGFTIDHLRVGNDATDWQALQEAWRAELGGGQA